MPPTEKQGIKATCKKDPVIWVLAINFIISFLKLYIGIKKLKYYCQMTEVILIYFNTKNIYEIVASNETSPD